MHATLQHVFQWEKNLWSSSDQPLFSGNNSVQDGTGTFQGGLVFPERGGGVGTVGLNTNGFPCPHPP